MLFNSLQFLVFFPIVVGLYFSVRPSWRWPLLLVASCYFYMVFIPKYILILFVLILIDYAAGLLIENARGFTRKLFLVMSLVANLGMLGFFKYFHFLNDNLNLLLGFLHLANPTPDWDIRLPIGLSFHTFQSLSYTIEVYFGRQKAERHLGIYAVYVLFFPQLVAGPIERPQNLLHQIRSEHTFEYQRTVDGLKLIMWGLFKKVVIADRLAITVDHVFNHPAAFHGIPIWIATYFFAFQIYCDFSGYSDIAIGSAQMMGFRLMDNFNRPYFSKSIPEFWKRWHISLSTWFRDYLYIPLGGNRVGRWHWQANLLLTFLISGIWHGANWTFVAWGGLHGFYMMSSIWSRRWRGRLCQFWRLDRYPLAHRMLQVFLTFQLVAFAWIFFRCHSFQDAFTLISHLFRFRGAPAAWDLGQSGSELMIGVLAILLMEGVHLLQRHRRMRQFLSRKPAWLRWPVYVALMAAILAFGKFNCQSFIYFQF